ncbi:MAG TPA: choloylglycine hydrolase family protein, partial [Gammaproteobacteria bacterium]|nr:choloylglycine hydrolase family protein [Gammaproteobacteria bacterium]
TAQDGTVIIARSLEFALDFHSNLRSSPRGRQFNTVAPDGKPSISWKAKYGYVFVDGLDIDIVVDGMNEAGLSFGALLFPEYASYPTISAKNTHRALPYLSLGDWILGNFKTVDEVRKALPTVFLYLNKIPTLGNMTFPLHYAISDATGKGIVVEYVKGEMHIYDNKLGVMTNSPPYDWQLTNMINYIHLSPLNPPSVMSNGTLYAATGQGYGMLGLPGDISPPSRFVKIAVLSHLSLPVPDADSALNLAQHIMNNVDVVAGEAREQDSGKYLNDITQWVVFKDLTHRVFYYRTYEDLSLRAVSLSKIDLSENAPRLTMPMASKALAKDLTDQFEQSKN